MNVHIADGGSRRHQAGFLLRLLCGPLCFVAALLAPELPEVSSLGMRAVGLALWIIAWWIAEPVPVPVTSLLLLPLSVLCGVWPIEKAFSFWADSTVLFLLGAFVIAHAMERHGLLRRLSLLVLTSKMVGGSRWRLLVLVLVACLLSSGFLSNIVNAVLFTLLGIGLLRAMEKTGEQGKEGKTPGDSFGMALFLGIGWATNIGGMLTPTGSVPGMIAVGMAGATGAGITYSEWFLSTAPFTLLQAGAVIGLMRFIGGRGDRGWKLPMESIARHRAESGVWSRGEKMAGGAGLLAVTLWVLPDLVPLIVGRFHPVSAFLIERLSPGVAALLVAAGLFLLPLDWKQREFTVSCLSWDGAIRGVEWGTLALVAGSIALASMMADPVSGLGHLIRSGISGWAVSQTSQIGFLFAVILIGALMTQLISNVMVMTTLAPLVVGAAPGLGMNPVALLITLSLSSSLGFALPSANPACAVVFAGGEFKLRQMLCYGFVLWFFGLVMVSATGYFVAAWILS